MEVTGIDRRLDKLFLNFAKLKTQLNALRGKFQDRVSNRASAAAHCGSGSLIAPATAAAVSAAVSIPIKVAVIMPQAFPILATKRPKPSR